MRGNSSSQIQSTVDQLQAQVTAMAEKLNAFLEDAGDATAEIADEAEGVAMNGFRHAAKDATKLKDKIVRDASAIGAGAYSAATGNATVAFGRFESFVGRNPTATLAAAVTVGFMLGLMNRK